LRLSAERLVKSRGKRLLQNEQVFTWLGCLKKVME